MLRPGDAAFGKCLLYFVEFVDTGPFPLQWTNEKNIKYNS